MKGSNSYWCNQCGYSAQSKIDVVRHIEARHLDLRLQCKFCAAVLKTKRNLQRHIRNNHVKDSRNLKDVMAYHFQ